MAKYALLLLGFLTFTFSVTAQNQAVTDLNSTFKPLKWRNIGPLAGGRSVATCGVIGDPLTYYMGTTGGGLWKTDDAGQTWHNVSDGFFKTGTVGAVAVADSDPNVVYVGMGEHAVRGVMTHSGDGVYKSTDAGKTWKFIGLAETRHIARIRVHPSDPNTLWVAAQGALYGPNRERGIYKSTDGGASWRQVYYADDKTGCVELSLDVNNPRVLYAAVNEYGRKPWQVISGGPTSALLKSTDGGETWEKLSEGLPKEVGKMAIAVCRSNPDKVYAVIEGNSQKEEGGLFVSDDAGKSWSRVSDDHRLVQRAWYYIEVFPDPNNDQTVYALSAQALRSTDGGRTWSEIEGKHGDFHDLWINPRNSNNLAIADDGGGVVSFNSGKTWTEQNYPTGQFYRINTDNQVPYHIYGGQQDRGSVSIASREFGNGEISSSSWAASAGGESAFLAFNPDDPNLVLGGSYQGTIEVLDNKAHATTNVMAAPIQYLGLDAKDCKYRFNWNAPIVWSKHEPNTFYHAAQKLLKTSDLGKTWIEVSPDLTRNEVDKQGRGGVPLTNEAVGAENYGTISYVIESPFERGEIWTGSDDGLVHRTTDGGKNWQNVTPKGLPECLINAIEVSPHDKATVYIATTRYKFNDHTPALYKTTDSGKNWTNISNGLPANAFTRVVREDPTRRDLLYAGTELGVFVSFDGGKNWSPLQLNLPITPVTDLKIHQNDLIASTSGRAFWILDDLNVVQQFQPDATRTLGFVTPENALLSNGSSPLNGNSDKFTGVAESGGINPANGIVLYYYLPELPADSAISLEVRDADGRLVRSYSSKKAPGVSTWDGGPSEPPLLSASKGLNRFVWDQRYPILPGVPGTYFENSFKGHKAAPGRYTFVLKAGKKEAKTQAQILPNPLYPKDLDYAGYHRTMSEMEASVTEMHQLINRAHALQEQIDQVLNSLPGDDKKFDKARSAGKTLSEQLKKWDEEMVQRKSKAYDDVENFPNKFSANYLFLLNQTESDIPRVNQPSLDLKAKMDADWVVLKKQITDLLDKDLPALNRLLWEVGVGAIWKRD